MRVLHEGHTTQNSLSAIQHLQRAVDLDPNFADAWAQLAGAWNSAAGAPDQIPNVIKAAQKAVSLNPNSALAYSMLASALHGSLDWAGAEAARLRSVELAPESDEILLRSALNLACFGRAQEALACVTKALQANPTSTSNLRTIYSGYVYAWSGEYDRAIEIFNQFPEAGFWMKEQQAQAYLAKGDYMNAIRLQRQAALATPWSNTNEVAVEFDALEAAFKSGSPEAYWKMRSKFEAPRTDPSHGMRMAEIFARLGHTQEAFTELRRAMREAPDEFSNGIYTNPSFESLRQQPEFQDLIAPLWRKKE
jgi:tetratricopeptide (TPR) repeat protein